MVKVVSLSGNYLEQALGNSRLGQTYAPLRWNFLGPEPLFRPSKIEERVESEAEIGSSEFHAGEFTCGFIGRESKSQNKRNKRTYCTIKNIVRNNIYIFDFKNL
ncbi:MAG: hypothetical protein ACOC9A_00070 [Candidatus Bipolaricaulota bacterium]